MRKFVREATKEIQAIFGMWRVWTALAHEDIGDQHKRTRLGPIWLLINYLIFAGSIIFIFHGGGPGAAGYAGYVAIGLLVWFYMMEAITLSVTLFVREESFIQGTKLPLTTYVMRLGLQSAIRAAYATVGCLGMLWFYHFTPDIAWVWSGVGILLLLAVTPAAITVFAFLGAYFPDSQFIVANLMRVGLFMTPVLWKPDSTRGIRHLFYVWDPFTYFLEIVRVPILTGTVPVHAFKICLVIGVFLWALALVLLGKYRRQIVFIL